MSPIVLSFPFSSPSHPWYLRVNAQYLAIDSFIYTLFAHSHRKSQLVDLTRVELVLPFVLLWHCPAIRIYRRKNYHKMRPLLLAFLIQPILSSISRPSIHVCMLTSSREVPYVNRTAPAVKAQLGSANFTIIDAGNTCPIDLLPIPLKPRLHAHGRDCETGENTDPLPSCRVRQQSLDVVASLRICHSINLVDWILFLEDDFLPCAGGIQAILSTLQNLSLSTKFARFTQGGGAVAFPRQNVLAYSQYLLDHYTTIPCDWALLGPWAPGPDYVHAVHTFKHIGKVSTIPSRNDDEYQRLYSGLRDNECGMPIGV